MATIVAMVIKGESALNLFEYLDENINVDEAVANRNKDCNSCGKMFPCPPKKIPTNSKKKLPPLYINATLCVNWQPNF